MKQETISAIAAAIKLVLDEVCQPHEPYPPETSKELLRQYYAERALLSARRPAAEDVVRLAKKGQTETGHEPWYGVYFWLLGGDPDWNRSPDGDFAEMLSCAKEVLAQHAKEPKPEPEKRLSFDDLDVGSPF